MHFAGVFSHWSWKLRNSIKNWATTKSTARYTRKTGTTWIIPFTNCFNQLILHTKNIQIFKQHSQFWQKARSSVEGSPHVGCDKLQWGTDGDQRLSKCSTLQSRTARCCCSYSHTVWGGVGSSPSTRHVCTAQGGAKQRNMTQSLQNSFTAILDPKNNSHVNVVLLPGHG